MAIIIETVESREGTSGPENPDRTLRYTVADELDDTAVDTAVLAEAPIQYAGLPYQSHRKRHLGVGVWEVEVRYGRKTPRVLGSVKFSFDTTGGKEKLTHSLASTYYVPLDESDEPVYPVTDFKNAINVHSSGGKVKVDGVEIEVPKLAFTLEYVVVHPPPGDFIDDLFLKTGSVNSDTVDTVIDGWTLNVAPGELKFMGATGEEDSVDPETSQETFRMSMRYEFSPNQTGLIFGDIEGVEKKGWHYLWVAYEEEEDDTAGKLVMNPVQINVEQVYPETTLAELFI